MTALLDRALAELKKRPVQEQDTIARDILARIGVPHGHAPGSLFGRGQSVLQLADPADDLIDLLSEEDIAAWYGHSPVAD
jgi:hypothetical protein